MGLLQRSKQTAFAALEGMSEVTSCQVDDDEGSMSVASSESLPKHQSNQFATNSDNMYTVN